ncbi:hypothetical protein HanRHA438_Chr02g0050881 [Helianthus annuus]|nr:hypothetical protein HanRHA438_Chr02g0050881 [Helianthus annuus]
MASTNITPIQIINLPTNPRPPPPPFTATLLSGEPIQDPRKPLNRSQLSS